MGNSSKKFEKELKKVSPKNGAADSSHALNVVLIALAVFLCVAIIAATTVLIVTSVNEKNAAPDELAGSRDAAEETSVPGCEAGGAVKTAISEPKRTTAAAADAARNARSAAEKCFFPGGGAGGSAPEDDCGSKGFHSLIQDQPFFKPARQALPVRSADEIQIRRTRLPRCSARSPRRASE